VVPLIVFRPASDCTLSPIRRSCTSRSPEGVEISVPFKKQLPLLLLLTVVVIVALGLVLPLYSWLPLLLVLLLLPLLFVAMRTL
jgi:hypothetical protein